MNYHRKCYQNYSSKKTISLELFKEEEPSKDEPLQDESAAVQCIRTRKSAVPLDKTKCIFCDCVKRNGDVELRNISTPRAQQTIQTKKLEQNLIALETKFHDNCLSTYIRKAERVRKKTTTKNNLTQKQNQ